MNLVRHHPDCAERDAEDDGGPAPHRVDRDSEEAEENRHRKKGDIAVGVDEAAPQKIFGIDVMHAEGNEKAVPDHGEVVPSPGAGAPVNEAGSEIGCCDPAGHCQRDPPLPQIDP